MTVIKFKFKWKYLLSSFRFNWWHFPADNLISLEEFIEGMRRIKTDRLNAISVEVRSDFKAIDKVQSPPN